MNTYGPTSLQFGIVQDLVFFRTAFFWLYSKIRLLNRGNTGHWLLLLCTFEEAWSMYLLLKDLYM